MSGRGEGGRPTGACMGDTMGQGVHMSAVGCRISTIGGRGKEGLRRRCNCAEDHRCCSSIGSSNKPGPPKDPSETCRSNKGLVSRRIEGTVCWSSPGRKASFDILGSGTPVRLDGVSADEREVRTAYRLKARSKEASYRSDSGDKCGGQRGAGTRTLDAAPGVFTKSESYRPSGIFGSARRLP
jgi:hypothetical protein